MERSEEQDDETAAEEEHPIPFFPNHLMKEIACVFLVLGALLSFSVLFPYELTPPSSPKIEAEEIGPAWYFNWMYVALKELPRFFPPELVQFGVPVMFVVLCVILMLLPFFDRGQSTRLRDRKAIVAAAIFAIVSYTVLTLLFYIT